MRIKRIQLKNFRTYENLCLDFNSRLTFLTGANAAGKTNIIEAINLLIFGKSFRGAMDNDMVKMGQSSYFVSANYLRDDSDYKLEFGYDQINSLSKKKIKLNGKALNSRTELIGNICGITFSPDDIAIIDGGPAQRRRFIDILLSFQNKEYLNTLVLYNRNLRQRNAVIKQIRNKRANKIDLDAWDQSLIKSGQKINELREDFINEFKPIFFATIQRISGTNDTIELELKYSSAAEKADYQKALQDNFFRDIQMGYTVTGPHRHTVIFKKDGRDITSTGSQGQKRSAVLSLRIAEFYHLKQKLGIAPILLIDDVIRELDANRRREFVALLHECGQAIFTTPDLDGLEDYLKDLSRDIEIMRVSGPGKIDQEQSDG